jgi:hypothetical protein
VLKAAWISLALFSSVANGQDLIKKQFSLGDLAYVEQSVPVTWICFDRATQQEINDKREKPYRCYVALERAGTFKIAAIAKGDSQDVLAYYTITVGGSAPGPDPPVPPGPIVVPADVTNKWGVGHPLYLAAVGVGDKQNADILGGFFNSMKADAVGGMELDAVQAQGQNKIRVHFAGKTAWYPVLKQVGGLLDSAEKLTSKKAWNVEEFKACMDECAIACKAAAR